MTALFWQSLIAISIGIAFYISYITKKNTASFTNKIWKNAHVLTITGWLLWTLFVLTGPLMNFQISLILVIAATSVFIINSINSRDKTVSKLKAAIKDAKNMGNPNFDEAVFREQAKEDAELNFISKIHPIDGVRNLKYEMYEAIRSASNRVLLMSGWASEYVIDETFIDLCVAKLSNGVKLHFGFGYNSSSAKRMPQWEKRGRAQMEKLMIKALDNGCDENLYVYEFNNHYKSLVKDSEFFVTGSINWLSNRQGKNFERAWKTEISALADREFYDCIVIMKPKRLELQRKLLRASVKWSDGN